MDIKIEKVNPDEINKFKELIGVFEEVFEMKNFHIPNTNYLQKLLEKSDFFVFVASLHNNVVGGLTSYVMDQYYEESPLVYIFDLAVKAEFQRKGIGKMLIKVHNDYCKAKGIETVMVQADEVDDHAIKFYQNTGGTAERVIHFDYSLTR